MDLMAPFVVVYDASVIYPIRVVDLLIRLGLKGFVQAKWTDAIHNEWVENLLEARPDLTRQQLESRRDQMNSAVRDCLVEGYEDLIDAIELPDPDDRHVVAAAIRAKAQAIISNNVADFPSDELARWDIDVQTADEFVVGLLLINRNLVLEALREQYESLTRPRFTPEEFLDNLVDAGLRETVAAVRDSFLAK
jgi:hypothetical protein